MLYRALCIVGVLRIIGRFFHSLHVCVAYSLAQDVERNVDRIKRLKKAKIKIDMWDEF